MPFIWVGTSQGTGCFTPVPTWAIPTSSALGTSGLYQTATSANQTMLSGLFGCGTNAATTSSYYTGTDQVEHSFYMQLARNRAQVFREQTEAERLAQEERMRAYRATQEERNREYNAALAKSRELLLEHLSPAQRATFEEKKWFVVQGGKTKTTYRIRTETYAGNIDIMEGGKVTHRLCVHCSDVPLYDHHVTQKLMLEYDEESVLKVANRTRVA